MSHAIHAQRRAFLGTLGGLALASLTGCGGGSANPSAPVYKTPLLIPAYFYSAALWQQFLPVHTPAHTIIANVASGPGVLPDPYWVGIFAQARASGHQLLGYVATTFGAKPAATVLLEIAAWKTLYGITDIFFDEVGATAATLSYYAGLVRGIRAAKPTARVVLNCGTLPVVDYFLMDTLTEVVVFENTWTVFQTQTFPVWLNLYWSRAHLIVNTAPLAALASVNNLANAHHAAGYFVTDVNTGSYHLNLPSYWANEMQL